MKEEGVYLMEQNMDHNVAAEFSPKKEGLEKQKKILIGGGVVIVILVFVILFWRGGSVPKSIFPLPNRVENFVDNQGQEQVNFQTKLTIEEVLTFYRDTFVGQGLTERELLTVNTDTTLNLVFDGHNSGKAIVVQAVSLSDNKTNVNVRLEKI